MELFILLFDAIIIFPMAVILHLCVWRAVLLWRDVRKVKDPDDVYEFEYRELVMQHFAMLFVDLAFVSGPICFYFFFDVSACVCVCLCVHLSVS